MQFSSLPPKIFRRKNLFDVKEAFSLSAQNHWSPALLSEALQLKEPELDVANHAAGQGDIKVNYMTYKFIRLPLLHGASHYRSQSRMLVVWCYPARDGGMVHPGNPVMCRSQRGSPTVPDVEPETTARYFWLESKPIPKLFETKIITLTQWWLQKCYAAIFFSKATAILQPT